MKQLFSPLLSVALSALALTSWTSEDQPSGRNKNIYVLVHGSWQAPYVWDEVKKDLQRKGHQVITVELPGHGADQTATHTINLDMYRDKVIDALPATSEKVILVGHSMAGMVISAVAEKLPGRIGKLVYIAAFVPSSGQNLGELAGSDAASRLGKSIRPSADNLTLDVDKDSLTELFISDGTAAIKAEVVAHYRAEPAIPFGDKITLTAANFGSVRKVYIKTLKDIVISTSLQDRMLKAAGIKEVHELPASHSPFLSQSSAVSGLLLKIDK